MCPAPSCDDDLFCGVNRAASDDPEQMSTLEQKHVPVISCPDQVTKGECFEVTVEVGKYTEHPKERGHYIHFVELYADETWLGRQEFTPETTCPVAKFCVNLEHAHDGLRAFEYCNLHGTWEGDKAIEVV